MSSPGVFRDNLELLGRRKDRFRGYPAVVVGAGPSLEKNVELLREARGRAVVVAVSTALKMLLGRGIRPDFTAIIDYHAISKRYFEGIAPEQAVPIICDLKASTEAIQAYGGRNIFANDVLVNSFLDGVPGDRGDLTAGSTVAHRAFNIVQFLGCDPIILAGLDLSYPDGRHHAAGTAIHEQQFSETNRFYTFEMKEWEWYLAHRKKLHRVPGISAGRSGPEMCSSATSTQGVREPPRALTGAHHRRHRGGRPEAGDRGDDPGGRPGALCRRRDSRAPLPDSRA